MRTTLLSLTASSLALAGCTPEPIDIPADMAEAAKTCFAVQMLSSRIEKNAAEDDPISLSEYSKAVQYSMIAAAKADDFNIETVLGMLPDADSIAKDFGDKDYKKAVGDCQKRFGTSASGNTPKLPEKDIDAGMACYSMSQFFRGGIEEEQVDTEGKTEYYAALNKRLETTLDGLIAADAEANAAFASDEGSLKYITAGLKEAFANGDPMSYLAACDKRFPAG